MGYLIILIEDLVEVMLLPSNSRLKTSPLPNTADLAIVHRRVARTMTAALNLSTTFVGVSLVRHTHLVSADDVVLILLLIARYSDEVRGPDSRRSEETWILHHLDELSRWDSLPVFVHNLAVIDLRLSVIVSLINTHEVVPPE
jgi:hypothetical protein